MDLGIKDRVAIVTGAAQGLGKAFAKALAAEGAVAIVADRNVDAAETVAAEIRAAKGEAVAVRVDVTEPDSVAAMAKKVEDAYGRIDILVNNAGVYVRNVPPATELIKHPFTEVPLAEWDMFLRINVTGPFLCARAVAPAMQRAKWGRIINVSSTTALLGLPGIAQYVTSKSAVFGLTRALARELGPHGITANTLVPGFVLVENENRAAFPDKVLASQVVPRLAVPNDLVGALLFLASESSGLMTGQPIVCDGGSVFT